MKKEKITIDNLAVMVKKGFDQVDERFKEVDERFKEIKNEISDFRKENSREHEEIKLKLDNVAYRFELEDLEKRVKKLEMKLKSA